MTRPLDLFLPCAAGVEELLRAEVADLGLADARAVRGGVELRAPWAGALRLNLWSRLAQRVLVRLSDTPYRHEDDIYAAAAAVQWEDWFTAQRTFRVELTAQRSPLKSLNFATLRIKDAVADRFRERGGERPSVDTHRPDVRLHGHLSADRLLLYIDLSGEPLFKRGWREDKGDAPLKETLAAAMLAASGWRADVPLYDPCCGSGTIVIEAAQMALGMAPGAQRRFGFERLLPHQRAVWDELRAQARAQQEQACAARGDALIAWGSDVSFRMVDFARRNAERAGVSAWIDLRGGDALQRQPPVPGPGVLMVNPPYGERIEVGGVAGGARLRGRQQPVRDGASLGMPAGGDASGGAGAADEPDFFRQLAAHWKRHYAGWTAHVLSPDLKLPSRMRLSESRRVPLWNGPIECRLFRFDLVAGTARAPRPEAGAA